MPSDRRVWGATDQGGADVSHRDSGYSRLAGADEDRTLARLRTLRSDLIDPIISVHHGRVVKRTGDGSIIEFRSVVDAVRCAVEVQNNMIERNAGVRSEKRIEFRVGIHVGDVVEESDGDLMGDGVNIAAQLEGIAKPAGDLNGATAEPPARAGHGVGLRQPRMHPHTADRLGTVAHGPRKA